MGSNWPGGAVRASVGELCGGEVAELGSAWGCVIALQLERSCLPVGSGGVEGGGCALCGAAGWRVCVVVWCCAEGVAVVAGALRAACCSSVSAAAHTGDGASRRSAPGIPCMGGDASVCAGGIGTASVAAVCCCCAAAVPQHGRRAEGVGRAGGWASAQSAPADVCSWSAAGEERSPCMDQLGGSVQ